MKTESKKLNCAMVKGCSCSVAYIDSSGFIYCDAHGKQRKAYSRCRKLKPAELKRLESGSPLERY